MIIGRAAFCWKPANGADTVLTGESKLTLLRVENLSMHFPVRGGVWRRRVGAVHAVDGVSLSVGPGETLGLVGESGCGKTTVGRCIIQLYRPTAGRVMFDGTELTTADKKTVRWARRHLQMIFQDPFESLNSRHTVGEILSEPFIIHHEGSAVHRTEAVAALLGRVGLAADAVDRFPHEFSGGQRQRIGIARAIALNPKLVICDEPVSALDVSIQSQIINLLLELQADAGLSYLFIAHDLAVVKHVSDTIAVMYLGRIVEYAAAEELYANPLHPYTKALIAAIPEPTPHARKTSVPMLTGDVPSPMHPPAGCHYHTRCPFTRARCRKEAPMLDQFSPGAVHHQVACHFAGHLE